jgi:CRISPR-associated exonuclease Cas4
MKLSGTQIAYYYICHAKLWYFTRHLSMERSSDLVAIGRYIHETAYSREKKEIRFGRVSIDFIKTSNGIVLHEVKKSKKMEKAHVMQVKFYLYLLKSRGIPAKAMVDYPLIRERVSVELDEQGEKELSEAMTEIRQIVSQSHPPAQERKKICPKCSYYELCWSD